METKYFNYPISLMQDTDKIGLLKIIAFSMMNFSEKMNYQKNSVANQMIYLYYRRQYFLTPEVKRHIEDMFDNGRLVEDENYHGFWNDTFTPESENEGMLSEFESNEDFYNQCINVYKQHQACGLFNLNPELISDLRYKHLQALKFIREFENINGTDAWTSVDTKLIFDVYEGKIPMDCLRLTAAVKSVTGKRNFNLTYKTVLLCRMYGCKKNSILIELLKYNPELKSKYELYSRRRQWDKLINSAMEQKFISHFCTGRQFFVSTTLTENELQKAIIKRQEIKLTKP